MPYNIKKAWANLKCWKHNCIIPNQTLFLETSNMGGSYNYCPDHAKGKGYNIDEIRKFDHNTEMSNLIPNDDSKYHKSFKDINPANEALTSLIWLIK